MCIFWIRPGQTGTEALFFFLVKLNSGPLDLDRGQLCVWNICKITLFNMQNFMFIEHVCEDFFS